MNTFTKNLLATAFAFSTTIGLAGVANANCTSGNCDDTGHTVVGDGSSVNDNDNVNNNTNLNDNDNTNTNTNTNQATGVNGDVTTGSISNNIEASASSAIATRGAVSGCVVIKPGFAISIVEASASFPGSVTYVQECEDGEIRIANNSYENTIISDFISSSDLQEKISGYVALAEKFPLFKEAMTAVNDKWSELQMTADATGKPVCVDANGRPLSAFSIAMMIVEANDVVRTLEADAAAGQSAEATPTRVNRFGPRR